MLASSLGDIQGGRRDRGVHVVSGETAAGSLRAAFGKEVPLLVLRDFLFSGPVPDFSDVRAFKALRAEYLSSLWPGLEEDIHQKPQDLLFDVTRLGWYDSITVWAGTGLEDTLLILFVVHLSNVLGLPVERIHLIRFSLRAGRKLPCSISQIAPAELVRHPQAVPLDETSARRFRAGWEALTSPDPQVLSAYVRQGAQAPTVAEPSLRFMMQRYPQLATGLNDWELALLRPLLQRGRTVGQMVASAMGQSDPSDAIRELLLLDMLLGLCAERAPQPLVELTGPDRPLPARRARLTAFGRAVLRGEASALSGNPLDRWIGGVHLSSAAGVMWLRDGQDLVQMPPLPPR